MLLVKKTIRNLACLYKPYLHFYISAFLLSILAIVWIIMNYDNKWNIFLGCPVKLLYDIPCPGCGMTRATISLLSGNIKSAFLQNPNSIIFVPILIIEAICGLIDVVFSKLYAYKLYCTINKFVSRPKFLIIFFIVELTIWLRNIYLNI